MKIQAWHFVNGALRDGTPTPKDGVVLKYTGPLVMCESGLHASREPFDALQYAPGPNLCLVKLASPEKHIELKDDEGNVVYSGPATIIGTDKIVSVERTIIARMDATEMLRYFARMQALSVIHLWEAPDVVLDYLMTGDELLRDAARYAARYAARAAARDAAWVAARDAAWAAARAAAWAAAWDAAWDAARDAARKNFNALVRECFWQYL